MRNIVSTSIALICCSALLFLASCEKENLDETETIITDPQGNGGDEFDCLELELNFQDFCQTEGVEEGVVNENCECVEIQASQPDCPDFFFEGYSDGNIGSPCETPDVPLGGTINENCECEGFNSVYDCPELNANFGDDCQTILGVGVVTENCDCEVDNGNDFDCPGLGNIGDPCQGGWGVITEDCDCVENTPGEECSETTNLADWYPLEFPDGFTLSVGEQCWTTDDEQGTVSENCECIAD